ncbi:DUF5082 family protein [Rossellomorea aquimaris]|nr:DUF5082 family protein [Rossellomorea aquimaris]WRP06296.1 DUF5082 family protein [Rossellomorea aquimaris]
MGKSSLYIFSGRIKGLVHCRKYVFIFLLLSSFPFDTIYTGGITSFFSKEMITLSYLSYLQSQLAEKKEQVNRLDSIIRELENIQNEFVHNRHSIEDPELSPHTWKGQLANAFQEVREDISLSYRDLYQFQLSESITIFENKVNTLHSEIQTLQYNISQEVARINEEKRKGDNHVG